MDSHHHTISRDERVLLEKLKRYCAYQERCLAETKRKCKLLGANELQISKLVDMLKKEGFLDEKRFATVFVHGKFNHNKWGRVKIRQELRNRAIDESVIDEALTQIDAPSYEKCITDIARNKYAALHARGATQLPERIAAYCMQKGYEPDIFWPVINKLLSQS